MKIKHHYLPQFYLRAWLNSEINEVWCYKTLVSNTSTPLFRHYSPKGIAYQKHLYTKTLSGISSDEIEQKFDNQIESPAAALFPKILRDKPLTKKEWGKVLRFMALQELRSPNGLKEHIRRMEVEMPQILNSSLEGVVDKLKSNGLPKKSKKQNNILFPVKVFTKSTSDPDTALLGVKTIVGRGTWLNDIDHVLNRTWIILTNHRWSILKPAPGYKWPVSDVPVVKLNYHSAKQYDFKGGYNSKGTEILFPVSPDHLIYTQVGNKKINHLEVASYFLTKNFTKFICESAHRLIISSEKDPYIPMYRERMVSKELINQEQDEWNKWHQSQIEAEENLLDSDEQPLSSKQSKK